MTDETQILKRLLGEACVEIAKFKVKYEASQKRVAELERELRQTCAQVSTVVSR